MRARRRLGIAAAMVAAALVAACGRAGEQGDRPPEEPTVSDGSAAASLEEVARRLQDRVDPDFDLSNVFPERPCATYGEGPPPWSADLPRYHANLKDETGLGGSVSVTVWAFSNEAEAEQLASAYTSKIPDCATSINAPPDNLGGHIATLRHTEKVLDGWQGMRTADAGYYANDSAISGWYSDHSAYAQRGVLFAAIEYTYQSDEGDYREPPPRDWPEKAESAVTEVLEILGAPSKTVSGPVADDDAMSFHVARNLPELDAYHPRAELVIDEKSLVPYGHAPDLLCNLLDSDEHFLSVSGLPVLVREFTADIEESEDLPRHSGPPDAVAAVEIIGMAQNAGEAERRADQVRDALAYDDPDREWGHVVAPCVSIGEAGQWHDYPLELRETTEKPYDQNGWTGSIATVAVRVADAPADAPTPESAAQVIAVVHRGPVVAYLRYQTGAGGDLDAALRRSTSMVDEVLDQLPSS